MKVVDRETFLKLPAGTVYAKFGGTPHNPVEDIGEICIKAAHRGNPPLDWYATSLAAMPDWKDSNEFHDNFERLEAGESLPADFDSSVDDGLYDQDQKFAVYDRADVDALIDRLKRAQEQAFGTPEK